MTVKEFINWLQKAPQEADVIIRDQDHDEYEIQMFEVATEADTLAETLRIVI